MNDAFGELIEQDKKRLRIRDNYKKSMIADKAPENDTDRPENYIYFPKSVLSAENVQMRKGLSWLFNGFIIKYGEDVIAVDPGVNFVLRLTEDNYDLNSINTLFISHLHLDHSADANLLMDWKIRARSKTTVLAPQSVFETRTISDYHAGNSSKFPINHTSYIVYEEYSHEMSRATMTFKKLYHGSECYGFKLNSNKTITYISDTGYAKSLKINGQTVDISDVKETVSSAEIHEYRKDIKSLVEHSDVLIVNIDSVSHNKNSKTHLSVVDLLHMLQNSDVYLVILAHINPVGELNHDEWGNKIASYVQQATGVDAISYPKEGLTIEI